MLYFVSDLDNTLIYSHYSKDYCVEVSNNDKKPITYMLKEGYYHFCDLLQKDDFKFIPCTMRSYEQVSRISFIQDYLPKFIICDNGGSIYINGKLDKDWDNIISKTVDKILVNNVAKLLKKKNMKDITTIRTNKDCFISIFFKDEESASNQIDFLKSNYEGAELKLHIQGRKLYLIPLKLDKKFALDYLIKKYSIKKENLITSGDSSTDTNFIKCGRIILLPNHATFKLKNIDANIIKCGYLNNPISCSLKIPLLLHYYCDNQNTFMENLCHSVNIDLNRKKE